MAGGWRSQRCVAWRRGRDVGERSDCLSRLHELPVATREAFHRGWMRTGDVLRADTDGFFYLTCRKKELIKYKGYANPRILQLRY